MAKQIPVLNKSFTFDAAITGFNLIAVASLANPGNAKLPAAALAIGFLGVTQEPTSTTLNNATVMTHGIAQIQSDGSAPVVAGDLIAVANASGQGKTVVPATGTAVRLTVGIALNSVAATAGLLIDVILQPNVYIGA